MCLLSAGCSQRSSRSGQTFPSSRSHPLERTTHFTGSADDMAVRLPRIHWAVGQVDKEHRWLPRVRPTSATRYTRSARQGGSRGGLPLALVGLQVARRARMRPLSASRIPPGGDDLAQFIAALQRIDATAGPPPGPTISLRGGRWPCETTQTRDRDRGISARYDRYRCGDRGVGSSPPGARMAQLAVWIHGDLQSGNLLAQQGRLSAVIDFGCLGVGDPACDLQVAWNFPLRRNPGGISRSATGR